MISLDTETTGKDLRHGAKPFLVTFCNESGENTWYLWDVDPFTREPEVIYEDLEEIRERIETADEIILHSAKFDITALQQVFLGRLNVDWDKIHDTLVSAHLLGSNQPKDLTSQALMYLSLNIKPYEDRLEKAVKEARRLVDTQDFVRRHGRWMIAKKGLPCMPSAKEETWRYDYWLPRAVAKAEGYLRGDEEECTRGFQPKPAHPWWTVCEEYANADSACTLPLYLKHKAVIEKRGHTKLHEESEKLPIVLYEMENYGVTLSGTRLEDRIEEYKQESEEMGNLCVNLAAGYGHELVLPKSGNNGSLKSFLLDVLRLPITSYTDKGNPSLDKNVMDAWENELPERSKELLFIESLKGKRSRDTAVAYLEGYQRFWKEADPEGWYRLHPWVNQTTTDTLRLSSQYPNSQNVSAKEGFNLRYAFGPLPGRLWVSFDYNNIELRIPAWDAEEPEMMDLFLRPDDPPYFGSLHALMFHTVYPKEFEETADRNYDVKTYQKYLYKRVKNGDFASQYLAGDETADRTYGKPGALRLVKSRFNRIHGPGGLNDRCMAFANRHGYIETLPDKEIDPDHGYPLLCTRSQWGKVKSTVPLNFRTQGTACWVVRRAMVKIHEYLKTLKDWHLIMNVHDELDFDFPANCDYMPILRNIAKIMESMGDCIGVPLTVGCELHRDNWSKGEKVCLKSDGKNPTIKSPGSSKLVIAH